MDRTKVPRGTPSILTSFRSWHISAAALLFILSAASAHGDTPFQLFPGPPTSPLTKDDLILHRMNDEFYGESWYLSARFADGTLLFLHYGVSNAGLGNFHGAVEHTAILPDGAVIFDKAQFSPSQIRYTPDRLKIQFDNVVSLEGELHRYRMRAKTEKFSYNLEIIPEVPGLKFGKGKTLFPKQNQFYALVILTPRAQIQGTLTIAGKKRIQLPGIGYMDHAWQNYPAHRMADRLYSLRGFDPTGGVTFLTFFYPGGGEIGTLVLHRDRRVRATSSRVTTQVSNGERDADKPHYTLPRSLTLTSPEGITGSIRLHEQLMRQDAVSDFNLFERTLIKMFVADPILYRHRATYEFFYENEKWQGEGVVETVILRE